jgi:tetratricopeptide (TPR) repeat protein
MSGADAPGAASNAKTGARSDAKTGAKGAKAGGRTEAQARADGALQARQLPRVIQPIPDSFSASGPVEAGSGAGGDEAWDERPTAESMLPEAPRADEVEPERPVLPAGGGRAAGAALGTNAAAVDARRTLLGVPAGLAGGAPAYGSPFTEDEDESPTEEAEVVVTPAPSRAAGGPAADEPGDEYDEYDDEPGAAPRLEDMPNNPLDHKLPRPSDLAPAGSDSRPPAAEATGRPGGPGAMAGTMRGPAPVPMAPAGRAGRPEDGAQAAPAPADRGPGAASGPGAGPAARVFAASQAEDAGGRRSPADGPGAGAGPADGPDDEFDGPRRLGRGGLAHTAAMDGPRGPSAGLARRTAVEDVAFAGGKIRVLHDDAGDETSERRPVAGSSRAGRWIVVVALVLMAASAAVVYMLVFRPTGDVIDGLALGQDAGSADPGAPDGGAVSVETAELEELVRTGLAMDTQAGLEALDRQLQATGGEVMLAERARVHTALAQHLFDAAALAGGDATRAGELERKAKALVLEALTLAQRALQDDREDPDALVAMADVQRLQGRQAPQVESYLVTALARQPEHREARLVRALTLAASERTRKDARALLESLSRSAQGIDVRPGYRLALLDVAEAHPDDARRRATEVLAVDPAHEGARALLAHLDASPTVDTSDPMPVEEAPTPAPEDDGRDRDDRDRGGRDTGGGSYDDLVAQGDKKAKARDCGEAMKLYERALDENPSGVSALMGMAECHLERKEFASAYGKLQAVLGVSPSYAEALWRMAEGYRKQGLNTQAVSWYRKYVEEHPSGPRASRARKRIDELGTGAPAPSPEPGGTEPPAGGGSGTEPPAGGGTEPPAGQGDPPPAPGSGGSGDTPGSAAD